MNFNLFKWAAPELLCYSTGLHWCYYYYYLLLIWCVGDWLAARTFWTHFGDGRENQPTELLPPPLSLVVVVAVVLVVVSLFRCWLELEKEDVEEPPVRKLKQIETIWFTSKLSKRASTVNSSAASRTSSTCSFQCFDWRWFPTVKNWHQVNCCQLVSTLSDLHHSIGRAVSSWRTRRAATSFLVDGSCTTTLPFYSSN